MWVWILFSLHNKKTSFKNCMLCLLVYYLWLIFKFVWWSETLKCGKHAKKKKSGRGPTLFHTTVYIFLFLFANTMYYTVDSITIWYHHCTMVPPQCFLKQCLIFSSLVTTKKYILDISAVSQWEPENSVQLSKAVWTLTVCQKTADFISSGSAEDELCCIWAQ